MLSLVNKVKSKFFLSDVGFPSSYPIKVLNSYRLKGLPYYEKLPSFDKIILGSLDLKTPNDLNILMSSTKDISPHFVISAGGIIYHILPIDIRIPVLTVYNSRINDNSAIFVYLQRTSREGFYTSKQLEALSYLFAKLGQFSYEHNFPFNLENGVASVYNEGGSIYSVSWYALAYGVPVGKDIIDNGEIPPEKADPGGVLYNITKDGVLADIVDQSKSLVSSVDFSPYFQDRRKILLVEGLDFDYNNNMLGYKQTKRRLDHDLEVLNSSFCDFLKKGRREMKDLSAKLRGTYSADIVGYTPRKVVGGKLFNFYLGRWVDV